MPSPSDRLTDALRRADLSDPSQADLLLPLIYDELRALAARHLRRERDGHTLQPTALVHEAYLRLAEGAHLTFEDRTHFFRVAARAMRRVLVDVARRRGAEKRGGEWRSVTLEPDALATPDDTYDLIDLHEALARLGQMDSALERLVELRFFTGLTLDEAAESLGVSRRKAAKDWSVALLWLRRELTAA
jgi:RNA polymerase sigma factor (TIGR02999 family)